MLLFWLFMVTFCYGDYWFGGINSSGTKSAIFWKQFKLSFFGSIWVIETQKIWSRDFFFKNAESTGGISIFCRFLMSHPKRQSKLNLKELWLS